MSDGTLAVHAENGRLHRKIESLRARVAELEAKNAKLQLFIRRFSRWAETPVKPDLFFGKLNLLYMEAAEYDYERAPAATKGD